jgi:ribose transport system permease protein
VLVLLMAAVVWLTAALPTFRAPANLLNVGQQAGMLGIMVFGEALVILTGGIDLSVGAIAAMAACVAGSCMAGGMGWAAAVGLGLVTGAAAGWLNGALITYRGWPPILTTLATLLLYRSLANIFTGAKTYTPLPTGYTGLGTGWTPVLLFVGLLAVLAVAQARARFGRHVMAVGGAEQAARLTGLPTASILRRVYLLSGLFAAAGGILLSASANAATWDIANEYELQVIAAVVIGGVRLTGGEGSLIGAALGAVIIVVMQNALILYGRPVEQYGLITGIIILLAAFAEQARRSREAGSAHGG